MSFEIQIFILYDYHPDTLYLHEQECEDLWLLFKARKDLRTKFLETLTSRRLITKVECEFMIFYVCYFKTLSVAKLCSISICVRISDEMTLSGLKNCPSPNLSTTNPS